MAHEATQSDLNRVKSDLTGHQSRQTTGGAPSRDVNSAQQHMSLVDQQERSEVARSEKEDPNFSYKEVSELSDATDDIQQESVGDDDVDALNDYEALVNATHKKMTLLSESDQMSESGDKQAGVEKADEFLRNFFIKFGMKKTLDQFQTEWYELKATGELDISKLPHIPPIYQRNQQLSDELAVLQDELDEARIIAEKARSTYDKLRKQRDYQKINHRRVQQEKARLNKDAQRNMTTREKLDAEYAEYSRKYEVANQEKLLMKLEKDRLVAKVENLEMTLQQNMEEHETNNMETKQSQPSKSPKKDKLVFKATNQASMIPKTDRPNPYLSETYEPSGAHMTVQKTFKGHLMGVTALAFNPKKEILATASDDTTWKLWSVPNGDLIMSGEGHLDWIGGVEFHPRGNLLATASGDGTVKIWDFVNACCAQTFSEHGQPVWKVAYHDTGDFLLSCSMDHTIKLWDMNLAKSRFTFRSHVDSVNSIQFKPFSQQFVSGSGDKTVSLWDIRTNVCVQTFYGHNNAVNSTKFNFQGDRIVSSDSDGITKVWDIRMVKEVAQLDSGLNSANCATFDRSGQFVYVASEDSTIKVFNAESGEKEGELKGHEDAVLDLTWDNQKDGYLVSASSDCSFRLWQ